MSTSPTMSITNRYLDERALKLRAKAIPWEVRCPPRGPADRQGYQRAGLLEAEEVALITALAGSKDTVDHVFAAVRAASGASIAVDLIVPSGLVRTLELTALRLAGRTQVRCALSAPHQQAQPERHDPIHREHHHRDHHRYAEMLRRASADPFRPRGSDSPLSPWRGQHLPSAAQVRAELFAESADRPDCSTHLTTSSDSPRSRCFPRSSRPILRRPPSSRA